MSDGLIAHLTETLAPARRGAVQKRLLMGLSFGYVAALLTVASVLGLRLGDGALFGGPWMRFAYPVGMVILGLWCAERLSRPAGEVRRRAPWLLVPVMAIAALGALQILAEPPAMRMDMMMAVPDRVCSCCVVLAVIPLFASLLWALRGLAPTALQAAGAVAGLTAGAGGASILALYCADSGPAFIALWYSIAMLAPAVIGALIGPKVLRW